MDGRQFYLKTTYYQKTINNNKYYFTRRETKYRVTIRVDKLTLNSLHRVHLLQWELIPSEQDSKLLQD